MRFTADLGALKPTVGALVRWGQGKTFSHFRHALLEVGDGSVGLTYTTPLGTAHLTCDADVESEGTFGVDIEMFHKFLSPYRGKGWELRLTFEPDLRTEDRQIFEGQFFEEGCKRNRVEWPFSTDARAVFCDPDWVPEPIQQRGVINEFLAPRPRLLSLLSNGTAAHSQVEQSMETLHSAGFVVAADVAAVYTANSAWGIRSELWADGELGFNTGWTSEPRTVSVDAESLSRARLIVDAFGGVEPWAVQVSEHGPLRLCPISGRKEAWVLVKEANDPLDVPSLLDELRAARASKDVVKVTGSFALNQRTSSGLRSVLTDLEVLDAYGRVDQEAQVWTMAIEPQGLTLEATSSMHVGAQFVIDWVRAPEKRVVRNISGPRLASLLKAVTANAEPDAEVEVSFWSSGDLERLYFRTSCPKGEAADALLAPMSGEPRRLADMTKQLVEA